MTLDFFVNNYNLLDFKINKANIKNNKLFLNVNYDVYLELIANGYRPEMDMEINKEFIFNVSNINNHNFKKPFNISNVIYENNELYFKLNDIYLEINGEIIIND